MMKFSRVAVVVALFALIPGCKKTADTTPNYKNAINAYYEAHPACLFANEKQFPVQSSPDDAKTEGYDALVDDLTLSRLAGVSHWVQQAAPEAVNRVLLDWLELRHIKVNSD